MNIYVLFTFAFLQRNNHVGKKNTVLYFIQFDQMITIQQRRNHT